MDADDLARGALLGGWCGDAAGAHLEFETPPIPPPALDAALGMAGGGPFGLGRGQVTDDSELEMALLLALAEHSSYPRYPAEAAARYPRNPAEAALRYPAEAAARAYVAWHDSGPFDMGRTCGRAFGFAKTAAEVQANALRHNMASEANGALMRSAALAVWGQRLGLSVADLADAARADARLSHPNAVAQDANAAYVVALGHLLRVPGDAPGALAAAQATATEPAVRAWLQAATAAPSVSALSQQDPTWRPASGAMGHARYAFTLAMHFLAARADFEAALRATLQLGGDTDTNAKVVGSLLGALHGARRLPPAMAAAVLAYDCTVRHGGLGVVRPACYRPAHVLERWFAAAGRGR